MPEKGKNEYRRRQRTYAEKEKMAKKSWYPTQCQNQPVAPSYSPRQNPIQRYGEYCLCVRVCDLFSSEGRNADIDWKC